MRYIVTFTYILYGCELGAIREHTWIIRGLDNLEKYLDAIPDYLDGGETYTEPTITELP